MLIPIIASRNPGLGPLPGGEAPPVSEGAAGSVILTAAAALGAMEGSV